MSLKYYKSIILLVKKRFQQYFGHLEDYWVHMLIVFFRICDRTYVSEKWRVICIIEYAFI